MPLESDVFSHFRIEIGKKGIAVALFYLRTPELRPAVGPEGPIVCTESLESRFDERSLKARIENLNRQGLDASMSEAAMQALRQATESGATANAQPAAQVPAPLDIATGPPGPIAEITHDIILVAVTGPGLAEPRIGYVNPAFMRLTGYAAEEVVGQRLSMLYGPATNRRSVAALDEAIVTRSRKEEEVLLYLKTGRPRPFQLQVSPLRPKAGESLSQCVLLGRPAYPVGRGPIEMESITQRDELTGLFRQEILLEALANDLAASAGARRHAPCIAYFRAEEFGALAAEFGPQVGNALLLGIADGLAANVRRVDITCCLGGAEFAVYMRDITLSDARLGAKRIGRMITASPVATARGPMPVRLGIGIAQARLPGPHAEPGRILAEMLASARRTAFHRGPRDRPAMTKAVARAD